MAGAIAGTTILNTQENDQIQAITLTVNNACNLACPHCYLQAASKNHFVDDETIKAILSSSAHQVAIVGKEPLVNLEQTEELIKTLAHQGKRISMITNGLLLHRMKPDVLQMLDHVDVSLDGGPKTYPRGNFDLVKQNLNLHPKTNILNTIYNENSNNINDMLAVPHNIMLFSPYVETDNYGMNKVSRLDLKDLVNKLDQSKIRDYPGAILLIDMFHLEQSNISKKELQMLVEQKHLSDHVKVFASDPIHNGIVRITYEGKLLTPADSLHTRSYRDKEQDVEDIDKQYKDFVS